MKLQILFFIGTLQIGGAERQIAQLATGLAKRGHTMHVVTFYPGGPNWESLKKYNSVRLQSLFPRKADRSVGVAKQLSQAVLRLRSVLCREKISVIYSALYMSNLIAWLSTRNMPTVKLIWGIRASNLQLNWKRAMPFHICKWLSPSVDLLIANSKVGLSYHRTEGYRTQKYTVIPNGIDTQYFQPNLQARSQVRSEWGVTEQEKLIGIVGRLMPIKDHPTFLRAAAHLLQQRNDVRFVCVGEGKPAYQKKLYQFSQGLGLGERIIWAGTRTDMPRVYNAFDIASLSSYGEGFPNVVGEAMACGVPCVVTDVGDSAWIVGESGIVVPPKNPRVLAEGWKRCLTENDASIKDQVRSRIVENFSLNLLIERTEEAILWLKA